MLNGLKLTLIATLIIIAYITGIQNGTAKGAKMGFEEGIAFAEQQKQEQIYSSLVTNITYCESRDIHDRTSYAGAYGRAQFMERTFNWMKGLAGKPHLQWRSEADQMWLLNWAVRNGYGKHWQTCYHQAVAKTTESLVAWNVSF